VKLIRRLRFLDRRKLDADLADEMELHQAMSGGRVTMGNTTLAREDARGVRIFGERRRFNLPEEVISHDGHVL
jgi:hypothetical protein